MLYFLNFCNCCWLQQLRHQRYRFHIQTLDLEGHKSLSPSSFFSSKWCNHFFQVRRMVNRQIFHDNPAICKRMDWFCRSVTSFFLLYAGTTVFYGTKRKLLPGSFHVPVSKKTEPETEWRDRKRERERETPREIVEKVERQRENSGVIYYFTTQSVTFSVNGRNRRRRKGRRRRRRRRRRGTTCSRSWVSAAAAKTLDCRQKGACMQPRKKETDWLHWQWWLQKYIRKRERGENQS